MHLFTVVIKVIKTIETKSSSYNNGQNYWTQTVLRVEKSHDWKQDKCICEAQQ